MILSKGEVYLESSETRMKERELVCESVPSSRAWYDRANQSVIASARRTHVADGRLGCRRPLSRLHITDREIDCSPIRIRGDDSVRPPEMLKRKEKGPIPLIPR